MYVKKQFLDNECSKCRKRNHIFTTTSANILKNKNNFPAILLQILHALAFKTNHKEVYKSNTNYQIHIHT